MAKHLGSQKDLFDLALFYCSKRETSRAKMGQYLTRKLKAQKVDEPEWVENVLNELERLMVIDDARYGDMLARNYQRAGKGKRYVENKLKEKGIKKETFTPVNDPEAEEERALEAGKKLWARLLKQKIKIPKAQARMKDAENRIRQQKLMQKLVTAGYSFDLVKRVVPLVIKTM